VAVGVLHAPAGCTPMSVDLTRQHWYEGHRRLEGHRDDEKLYRQLLGHVEAVTDELRRRVGSSFTLAELAACYRGAERWARDAIEERAPGPGWPGWVATAADAAFHLYARGARDYAP
jgi:hypothetical protein